MGSDGSTQMEQSLINDIPNVIKDWYQHLIAFLNAQNYSIYESLLEYINHLIKLRQIFISNGLSLNQVKKLKLDMVETIQTGNALIGKEVLLRDDQTGSLVLNYDFMKMYRLHAQSNSILYSINFKSL